MKLLWSQIPSDRMFWPFLKCREKNQKRKVKQEASGEGLNSQMLIWRTVDNLTLQYFFPP